VARSLLCSDVLLRVAFSPPMYWAACSAPSHSVPDINTAIRLNNTEHTIFVRIQPSVARREFLHAVAATYLYLLLPKAKWCRIIPKSPHKQADLESEGLQNPDVICTLDW
jgi:hypothetical protein